MSDLDWLSNYASDTTTNYFPSAPVTSEAVTRTETRSSTKPWLTKFPPTDNLLAMRVQFFDNGPKPGRGRAQHTLKFRIYLDNGRVLNQKAPDWWRVVQLINPAKVVAWAEKEHAAGKLTDEGLDRYQAAAKDLHEGLEGVPEVEWAKMGHIGSQPGTHYFHGQFVTAFRLRSGEMGAILYLEDEQIEIGPFYSNTRSDKQGAPKMHALHDPYGRIAPKRSDDDEL